MRIRVGLIMAILVAAAAARAEVRLVAGAAGPQLDVHPVAQRIWTPRGIPDSSTVNPGGDLIGDGFPAQRSADGRLVAAWQRPSNATLVVLRAAGRAPATLAEVAVVDAVGVPTVTMLDSGFLVAWQGSSTTPEVHTLVATDGGVSTPVSVVPGRLLAAFRVGDSIHLVALDAPAHALNIATIPASYVPNPFPAPISRAPLLRTFAALPLETVPAPAFVASPDTWLPCVDEQDADVVLAWEAGRGVLGRVVLSSSGVRGAGEFFRGPNGSCQAVLNAAARH